MKRYTTQSISIHFRVCNIHSGFLVFLLIMRLWYRVSVLYLFEIVEQKSWGGRGGISRIHRVLICHYIKNCSSIQFGFFKGFEFCVWNGCSYFPRRRHNPFKKMSLDNNAWHESNYPKHPLAIVSQHWKISKSIVVILWWLVFYVAKLNGPEMAFCLLAKTRQLTP